jgi:hypothetical protein
VTIANWTWRVVLATAARSNAMYEFQQFPVMYIQ